MAPNQMRFVLKLANYCKCDGCDKTLKRKTLKRLLKIDGVNSTLIDAKTGELTVSGPVDPQEVITFLEKEGKTAKLVTEEIQAIHQEMLQFLVLFWSILLIVTCFYAYRSFQFLSGLISKSVDKPMERDIHDCDPKFWSILLTVTCFCAYRSFQFLSDLISNDCDPKHDHKFELKSYNKPFKCNKCREDGFTSGYRCKHCIYDLHKFCLDPEPEITPEFFPRSTFKFRTEPGKICNACGMEIHGHSYSCKEAKLYLHPACSKLPRTISGTDFELCKKVKKCFWCIKKKKKPSWVAETNVAGLCYVSKRDKFSCHVHCLSLVMHEVWKRGRGDLDRNDDNDDDNDAISKVLAGKVDLKLMATAKGRGGEGGGLFPGAITIFLKTIIGILSGDPTGLIVFGLTELVQELLTL